MYLIKDADENVALELLQPIKDNGLVDNNPLNNLSKTITKS